MSFLNPDFLWLFLVVLLMFLYRQKNKESDIDKTTKRKLILLYISLFMMIFALARPVLEEEPVKQEYEGSEVVIALDLSYSMHAQDIKPNRLEASKSFIKELINSRIHERFALLGFTTNAIILSPLSSDAELLSHQIDLIQSEMVITKGTNISSVLGLSTKLSQVKSKNLIIVGDGGEKKDFSKEIIFAKENGLSVSVVMMATAIGSRIKDKHGNWIKDESNNLVITSRNLNIKSLSSETDGVFVEYDIDALESVSSWLDSREKRMSSEDVLAYEELFYYLVFLALLFFILGVTSLSRKFFKILASLLLLVGISLDADMREFSTQSAGDKAYALEKDLKDLKRLKKSGNISPEYHYNLANAYYKAGKYEKAIDTYKEIRSTKDTLKAKIFHNLGNSYVRLEMYEEAKLAYKKSLIINYDKETDENLLYITNFKKADGLQTGQQDGKKKNESKSVQNSKKDAKKKKGAGSSNMKVTAQSGAGSKAKGKKSLSQAQVNFNASQSALSYKQYELINERKTNEENPW